MEQPLSPTSYFGGTSELKICWEIATGLIGSSLEDGAEW